MQHCLASCCARATPQATAAAAMHHLQSLPPPAPANVCVQSQGTGPLTASFGRWWRCAQRPSGRSLWGVRSTRRMMASWNLDTATSGTITELRSLPTTSVILM